MKTRDKIAIGVGGVLVIAYWVGEFVFNVNIVSEAWHRVGALLERL